MGPRKRPRQTANKVNLKDLIFSEGICTVEYLYRKDRDAVALQILEQRKAAGSTLIAVVKVGPETFSNMVQLFEDLEFMRVHEAGICGIIPPDDFVARKDDPDPESTYMNSKVDSYRWIVNDSSNRQDKVPGVMFLAEDKFPLQSYVSQTAKGYFDHQKLVTNWAEEEPFQLNTTCQKLYDEVLPNYGRAYASDKTKTFLDSNYDQWNLNSLHSNIDAFKPDSKGSAGIHTSFSYYGIYLSIFPNHHEDNFYYSINYLHWGSPKCWFAVPLHDSRKMENVLNGLLVHERKQCPQFLQHKDVFLDPRLLKKHGVQVHTLVQTKGTFVITFPHGYHQGLNAGNNLAEAVNIGGNLLPDRIISHKMCICKRMKHCLLHNVNIFPFIKEHSFANDENKYFNYLTGNLAMIDPDDKSVKPAERKISCGPFGSLFDVCKYIDRETKGKNQEEIKYQLIRAIQTLTHFTDNSKLVCEAFVSEKCKGIKLLVHLLQRFKDHVEICQYVVHTAVNVFAELSGKYLWTFPFMRALLQKMFTWLTESPFAEKERFQVNIYIVLAFSLLLRSGRHADSELPKQIKDLQLDEVLTTQLNEWLKLEQRNIKISYKLDRQMYDWIGEDHLSRTIAAFILSNNLFKDYAFWKPCVTTEVVTWIKQNCVDKDSTLLCSFARSSIDALKAAGVVSRDYSYLTDADHSEEHPGERSGACQVMDNLASSHVPLAQVFCNAVESVHNPMGSSAGDSDAISEKQIGSESTGDEFNMDLSGDNSSSVALKTTISVTNAATSTDSSQPCSSVASPLANVTQRNNQVDASTQTEPIESPNQTQSRPCEPAVNSNETEKRRWSCDACKKSYATKQKLLEHQAGKHREKGGILHKCKICNYETPHPYAYHRHQRLVHKKKSPGARSSSKRKAEEQNVTTDDDSNVEDMDRSVPMDTNENEAQVDSDD